MTAAARTARYRARQKAGVMVENIELPVELPAVLVEAGFLRPDLEDDRPAIRRATERLLANLTFINTDP